MVDVLITLLNTYPMWFHAKFKVDRLMHQIMDAVYFWIWEKTLSTQAEGDKLLLLVFNNNYYLLNCR